VIETLPIPSLLQPSTEPREGEISGDVGEGESDNLLPMIGERPGENRDEILELEREMAGVAVFANRPGSLQGSHRSFFLRRPGRTFLKEATILGEPAEVPRDFPGFFRLPVVDARRMIHIRFTLDVLDLKALLPHLSLLRKSFGCPVIHRIVLWGTGI